MQHWLFAVFLQMFQRRVVLVVADWSSCLTSAGLVLLAAGHGHGGGSGCWPVILGELLTPSEVGTWQQLLLKVGTWQLLKMSQPAHSKYAFTLCCYRLNTQ